MKQEEQIDRAAASAAIQGAPAGADRNEAAADTASNGLGGGASATASRTAARRSTNRTQDIDRHVGGRIRERRIMLGLTQQQLADLIGVTYQHAHKYERGINRVSAGRLFEIAQVLSVPVNHFFEGLDDQSTRHISPRERMCLELARNFAQIPNERHQEALSQLARVLAVE
jgi:transcriptional regulator with XRE-family HTH domain